MASIFNYRGQWRAQVRRADGTRQTRDFAKHKLARQWADTIEGQREDDKLPWLGGPTQVTLAQLLDDYGRHFSVAKQGREAELNRINHYLRGAGLPLLKARQDEEGRWQVVDASAARIDAGVADGLQSYLAQRRDARARTYAAIAELAKRRVSAILRADIKQLMATMQADGLSASTIQKEIAMLKVVFNTMLNDGYWVGFANPCDKIPLGKSTPRFVQVSQDELRRLYAACAECDNPYMLSLVDCAIFLTARSGSLLELRWDEIDFEGRNLWLRKTKTGPVLLKLPKRVKAVLAGLPRHPSGLVFPLTENAVNMCWEGVREKAGLTRLQFRDLRHLGGTHYARRVSNAHVLREILGHKTIYMAQVYVNLAARDVQDILDATEPDADTLPPLPPPVSDTLGQRKARRLIAGSANADKPGPAEDDNGPTRARRQPGNIIAFPGRFNRTSAPTTPPPGSRRGGAS